MGFWEFCISCFVLGLLNVSSQMYDKLLTFLVQIFPIQFICPVNLKLPNFSWLQSFENKINTSYSVEYLI